MHETLPRQTPRHVQVGVRSCAPYFYPKCAMRGSYGPAPPISCIEGGCFCLLSYEHGWHQQPAKDLFMQKTSVLPIQDDQKEAGSSSNGGFSQAALAPRLQQSEEVVGMFGSETAARSGLLSSCSEMPASAVNHQRQVMKGSVSEVSPLSPAASLKLPCQHPLLCCARCAKC